VTLPGAGGGKLFIGGRHESHNRGGGGCGGINWFRSGRTIFRKRSSGPLAGIAIIRHLFPVTLGLALTLSASAADKPVVRPKRFSLLGQKIERGLAAGLL
jgi:hypothetical protein